MVVRLTSDQLADEVDKFYRMAAKEAAKVVGMEASAVLNLSLKHVIQKRPIKRSVDYDAVIAFQAALLGLKAGVTYMAVKRAEEVDEQEE